MDGSLSGSDNVIHMKASVGAKRAIYSSGSVTNWSG
jgi:hypothetical protein